MRCANCNTEISGSDEFCSNCGASINTGNPERSETINIGQLEQAVLSGKYIIKNSSEAGDTKYYEAEVLVGHKPVIIEERAVSPATWSQSESCGVNTRNLTADTFNAHNGQVSFLASKLEVLKSIAGNGDCSIKEYFVSGNKEYLVIEAPRGQTVSQIGANGYLAGRAAVLIALNICKVLNDIHESGYLYLDLAPDSIFVNEGLVSLFPFTRMVKAGAIQTEYLTTDGFSAPELYISGDNPITRAADIYSLGAVLHWMISGQNVPFTGIDANSILNFVKNPNLARIVIKCLAANPAERWENVTALRSALIAYSSVCNDDLSFDVAAASDQGMVRENNEDAFLVLDINRGSSSGRRSVGIYAVADGMGGHNAGEIASSRVLDLLAVELVRRINQKDMDNGYDEILKSAIEQANLDIISVSRADRLYANMGTTLTAIIRDGAEIYIGHVGDSRCYLVRNDEIIKLTRDHSVVAGLVEKKIITEEQARTHPDRGRLLRSIGGKGDLEIDVITSGPDEKKLALQAGDILLLCSDGLTDMLDDSQIKSIVMKNAVVEEICSRLIHEGNLQGGGDNITVIAVKALKAQEG